MVWGSRFMVDAVQRMSCAKITTARNLLSAWGDAGDMILPRETILIMVWGGPNSIVVV